MSEAPELSDEIHFRAVEVSARLKRVEAELIEVLQQVERHRVFIRRGYPSLFRYVTVELGLSESLAYSLITVARKALEVPRLTSLIHSGELTLSNARRIVAVLTPENQEEWISKACRLSQRDLEKEIVLVKPEVAVQERMSYVAADRVRLELGLSESEMLKLRRVQDLLSQTKKRAVSLEETLGILTSEYLDRRDPLERAKRAQKREKRISEAATDRESDSELVSGREGGNERIPASVRHEVSRRDLNRCQHILPNGERCNQARWVDLHHKIPVSLGGRSTKENLITLCSNHHKYWHLMQRPTSTLKKPQNERNLPHFPENTQAESYREDHKRNGFS